MTATVNDIRSLLRTAELDAQHALVETARRFANEAGIRNARMGLADALADIEEAQANYRAALDAERTAKETLENAEWDAGYEVDARIVTDENNKNKTYWLGDADEMEPVLNDDDVAEMRPTGRKVRLGDGTVAMARAYRDKAIQELDSVRKASTALREAEHATAAAKDGVAMAERRFTAARLQVQAAVAQLQLLGLVLNHSEKAEHA